MNNPGRKNSNSKFLKKVTQLPWGFKNLQSSQNQYITQVKGDTKKRELLKTPTKIEEIQKKKIIDRN